MLRGEYLRDLAEPQCEADDDAERALAAYEQLCQLVPTNIVMAYIVMTYIVMAFAAYQQLCQLVPTKPHIFGPHI